MTEANEKTSGLEKAVLGGGCFWCLEAAYQQIKGAGSVISGYAGGSLPNPTYEQVLAGKSGHAEVVEVHFDPKIINYNQILSIFWAIHDPTTPNRQGADIGPQYRSTILYATEQQRRVAEQSKQEIQKLWPNPIVTEIVPLKQFYPAEEYHRDYYRRNNTKPYCQIVINPKLAQLRQGFQALLKPD